MEHLQKYFTPPLVERLASESWSKSALSLLVGGPAVVIHRCTMVENWGCAVGGHYWDMLVVVTKPVRIQVVGPLFPRTDIPLEVGDALRFAREDSMGLYITIPAPYLLILLRSSDET